MKHLPRNVLPLGSVCIVKIVENQRIGSRLDGRQIGRIQSQPVRGTLHQRASCRRGSVVDNGQLHRLPFPSDHDPNLVVGSGSYRVSVRIRDDEITGQSSVLVREYESHDVGVLTVLPVGPMEEIATPSDPIITTVFSVGPTKETEETDGPVAPVVFPAGPTEETEEAEGPTMPIVLPDDPMEETEEAEGPTDPTIFPAGPTEETEEAEGPVASTVFPVGPTEELVE